MHADPITSPIPQDANPSPDDEIGDNDFLSHVDRVIAAWPKTIPACAIAANRPAMDPLRTTCGPTVTIPGIAVPDDRRLLRCGGCGWAVECLSAEESRHIQVGCILCGGLLRHEATAVDIAAQSDHPVASLPANHRLTRRRPVRSGVRVECRRGPLGLGPDLVAGIADLSEDGVGLRLKAAVRQGEETELVFSRPGGGPPFKVRADVCWCEATGDGTYRVGVRFRRRLAHRDLVNLWQ